MHFKSHLIHHIAQLFPIVMPPFAMTITREEAHVVISQYAQTPRQKDQETT